MPTARSMEIAARFWCHPSMSDRAMDVAMATAFAECLDAEEYPTALAEVERLRSDMETAWGLIANAYGGDWSKAPANWSEAARRWRDEVWPPSASKERDVP